MAFMGTPYTKMTMPVEITALELAEAWGVPPWEVMEHEGGLRWMAWFKLYHAQLNKAQQKMNEKK